jgi:hypothetical protein
LSTPSAYTSSRGGAYNSGGRLGSGSPSAGFAELPAKFPKIKAVNWFNWNIVEEGIEQPWPIETSASSATAFSKAINAGYFAENTFGSLTSLTKIKPIE